MATKANIVLDQGADYSTTITLADDDGNPIDLTGFTGTSQMRKSYTSSTAYTFTVQTSGVNGTITLSMNAANTTAITPGRYLYDVELTSNTGLISRVLEGIVTVTPNFTR